MNPAVPVSGEWASSFDVQVVEPPAAPPVPKPQPKLNVVLPFIETDMPQVIRLLEWCCELSGQLPYTLFLLPFKGINFSEVKTSAEKAFADVQIIQDSEGVLSDWKEDAKIRDAAGPNSMFRQAAWYFYFHQTLGPWLYLEPDCVPLKKDWLQELESDYREGNKPISGVAMDAADNKQYLNGVAIYPPNLVQVAPDIVTRSMWQQHQDCEIAFDIAGSTQVLQKSHVTEKIQFCYRAQPSEIKSTAVLFHGDRHEALIPFLKTRGSVGATRLAHNQETEGSIPSPAKNGKEGDESCEPCGDQTSTAQTARLSNGAVKFDPSTSAVVSSHPDAASVGHFSTIGDAIRFHAEALQQLENGQLSRHTRILSELRKRKLVPRPRRHSR